MASAAQRVFVDWEERFISHERGCRVVHYHVRDSAGGQWLAVIGTERSLRHMVYVVCDEFLPVAGLDKSTASGYKWRARREVVDWLSSFVIKTGSSDANHCAGSLRNAWNSSTDVDSSFSHEFDGTESGPEESGRRQLHDNEMWKQMSSSATSSDVVWVGPEWICEKKLKHFYAFQRNGVVISVRRFVYVMTEDNDRHIAHVEDLYEDKKQRKRLRVRWFHKRSEIGCIIPPPEPDLREVFYTSYQQELSVECVDGLATVLSPEHFQQCVIQLGQATVVETYVCSRQLDSEGIRPINFENVSGYSLQPVLSFAGLHSQAMPLSSDRESDDNETDFDGVLVKRGPRTPRRWPRRCAEGSESRGVFGGTLKSKWSSSQRSADINISRAGSGNGFGCWKKRPYSTCPAYNVPDTTMYQVGDHIEVLSQDSGIRGCWFQGTVVAVTHRLLRVRYDNLLDVNRSENLEEWVVSGKYAYNSRTKPLCLPRPTIRPARDAFTESVTSDLKEGSFVDAWRGDGWWEGVVKVVRDEDVEVFFPDDHFCSSFKREELRIAQEWVGSGCWVQLTDWTELTHPNGKSVLPEFAQYLGKDFSVGGRKRARMGTNSDDSKVGPLRSNDIEHIFKDYDDEVSSGLFDAFGAAKALWLLHEGSWTRPYPLARVAVKRTHNDNLLQTTSNSAPVGLNGGTGNNIAGNGRGKVRISRLHKMIPREVGQVIPCRVASVKEERLDMDNSRIVNPDVGRKPGGHIPSDVETTQGLKWKRKRLRQDVTHKGGPLSTANEGKHHGRKSPVAAGENGTSPSVKFSKGTTLDLRKLQKRRHGDENSVRSIHGTSLGGAFLVRSIPNLVMSR